jgi:CubicO group peptidase (beta-lactamase class C family)
LSLAMSMFAATGCGSSDHPTALTVGSADAASGDDGSTVAEAGGDATSTESASDDGGPSAAEQAAFDALQTFASNELRASNTPGASLAIVLRGKLAFAAGVGVSNTTTRAPVTTATRFRAASMSKMILAATAMSLVDDGTLDLHAPITDYVTGFTLQSGFDATSLTLDLLLSHSSGFPCDTVPFCDASSSGARQAYLLAHPQPLWATPGAIYDYSNAGFSLAAVALSNAAHVGDGGFEALVHDRVFAKAGMTTATYDAAAAEAGDHATGYQLDASGAVVGTFEPTTFDCPMLHAPGGVIATATDYAHFAEALLSGGGGVMSSASLAAMTGAHANMHTFATQSYGYGIVTQKAPYPDHSSWWHAGSLPGFTSEFWVVPDDRFAVVVLTNARGSQPVADAIVGKALGLFISESRPGVTFTSPSSTWSQYVGTYDDDYGALGKGVVVSLSAADAGAPTLSISAPNAVDSTGAAAPIAGAMKQAAIDAWQLPNGELATFFPGASGGSAGYVVTRAGVGVRVH